MRGYRKLIMFVVLAGIASFVQLTETQADVLITLAWAGIGGNAAVHLGAAAREAVVARNSDRASGPGGRSVRGE
jgi:hypothetical protein